MSAVAGTVWHCRQIPHSLDYYFIDSPHGRRTVRSVGRRRLWMLQYSKLNLTSMQNGRSFEELPSISMGELGRQRSVAPLFLCYWKDTNIKKKKKKKKKKQTLMTFLYWQFDSLCVCDFKRRIDDRRSQQQQKRQQFPSKYENEMWARRERELIWAKIVGTANYRSIHHLSCERWLTTPVKTPLILFSLYLIERFVYLVQFRWPLAQSSVRYFTSIVKNAQLLETLAVVAPYRFLLEALFLFVTLLQVWLPAYRFSYGVQVKRSLIKRTSNHTQW